MTEPHIEDLAFEDVQRIKYDLWSTPTLSGFESADPAVRIVAEGDSWFDYPLGLDILDNLKRQYGYEIFKVAEAGDTLENMVYAPIRAVDSRPYGSVPQSHVDHRRGDAV